MSENLAWGNFRATFTYKPIYFQQTALIKVFYLPTDAQ